VAGGSSSYSDLSINQMDDGALQLSWTEDGVPHQQVVDAVGVVTRGSRSPVTLTRVPSDPPMTRKFLCVQHSTHLSCASPTFDALQKGQVVAGPSPVSEKAAAAEPAATMEEAVATATGIPVGMSLLF
jgi:hypothetical protein